MSGQISPQHINHKSGRLRRGKHGQLGAFAHRQQRIGRRLAVSHHQHRRLQRDDARDASGDIFRAGMSQVSHFTQAQNLHPIRMDVVQVTDQIGTRPCFAYRQFIKTSLRSAQASDPLPFQGSTMVFK